MGDYFSRTYTDLPSHSMIYFAYSWWAIDSWNTDDYFEIQIDDTVIEGWSTYNYPDYTVSSQLCGASGSSYPDIGDIRVFGRVIHSATSFMFKMISGLDQDSSNESYGFRAMTFLLVTSPTTTGAAEAFCGISSTDVGDLECDCDEGQYLDSSSTCVDCDDSCSSCFGSGSDQCYECATGYSFDGTECFACTSPCTSCSSTATDECYECESGYLLYYNQCVLASECVSPLYEDDCDTSCVSPCDTDEYVYANSSCSEDCIYPLQKSTILDTLVCIYPCDSDEYLYWDGTCEDSCESPLTIRIQADEVYCDYGCDSSQYLYWNGTCSDSCPSPLVSETEHDRLFCIYPCDIDEFLYPNGTCGEDSCDLQYTLRVEADRNYCDLTCSNYQLWNGTCVDTCDSPMHLLTNASGTFCSPPCDDITEYYYPEEETCKSTCDDGTSSIAINIYLVCYVNDDYIEQRTLSKLLHHIRYVDVQFPAKLGNISIMRGTNIISPRVIPSVFAKVVNWPARWTLAAIFEYYYLPSSFLANFGDDLVLLGMILTVAVLAFILENIFTFCPNLKLFFKRLRIMTQWNLPIMIIVQNAGDIFFFAVIELKTLDLTSQASSIVSFIFCILMLVLVLAVFSLGIYLAKQAQTTKNEARDRSPSLKSYVNFVTSWEKFQVLFRGFDDKSLFSRSFLLIYTLRLMIPMVFASFLYTVPLLQGIVFWMITASMLLYLLCKKPIRKRIDLINLFLVEFLILFTDASLLVLIALDMRNSDATNVRTFFGEVIIVCDYCLDIFACICLFIKALMTVRTAFYFRKQSKRKLERSTWLQLLFLPLQQGSLGFEQFQVDTFSEISSPSQHETSQSLDEVSSVAGYQVKGLQYSNSGINQTTIWELTNSRSQLDGIKVSQRKIRRIAPFQSQFRVIEEDPSSFDHLSDTINYSGRRKIPPYQPQSRVIENNPSLDNIPDTLHYSSRKRIIRSNYSGSQIASQVWTDSELYHSRPKVASQRQVYPINQGGDQELAFSSTMMKHMSTNNLSSQRSISDAIGRMTLRRSNTNASKRRIVQEEDRIVEEDSIEQNHDRSQFSETTRRTLRRYRDEDLIYPTIMEDPEPDPRFRRGYLN